MDKSVYFNLAERIVAGDVPGAEAFKEMMDLPESRVFDLFAGADMIRESYFGREIHLCTICNAKSGRCSEDCAFCSQSAFARTDAPVYPLLTKDKLQAGALAAWNGKINRYSIVTSGRSLLREEVAEVANAIRELEVRDLGYCVSLGILDRQDFALLKEAGITRLHHNLETSESFFSQICTTHTFQERIETIKSAKDAGLSVCVGGLFGMGETDSQALELALTIRELDVDSVPINFLTPIKGTRLENMNALTPLRCLKIIAMFRYVLPGKDILICGGREANLKELHPMVFYAGASGIMTGNYLTTSGRAVEDDLKMIERLQFSVRKNASSTRH
jgi:biotin synthase